MKETWTRSTDADGDLDRRFMRDGQVRCNVLARRGNEEESGFDMPDIASRNNSLDE